MNAKNDHLFSIGAFAIIFNGQQHVLLCHRRDFDLWNLPSRVVENGELPTEAAIRETREETGKEGMQRDPEFSLFSLISVYIQDSYTHCGYFVRHIFGMA